MGAGASEDNGPRDSTKMQLSMSVGMAPATTTATAAPYQEGKPQRAVGKQKTVSNHGMS